MNREYILNLSKREIDALLAEHLYNYKHGKTPKDYDGLNGGDDILIPPNRDNDYFIYPPRGKVSYTFHVPQYSENLDSAYEVLLDLEPRLCSANQIGIRWMITKDEDAVSVRINKWHKNDEVPHWSECWVTGNEYKLAEMICQCVLMTVLKISK